MQGVRLQKKENRHMLCGVVGAPLSFFREVFLPVSFLTQGALHSFTKKYVLRIYFLVKIESATLQQKNKSKTSPT